MLVRETANKLRRDRPVRRVFAHTCWCVGGSPESHLSRQGSSSTGVSMQTRHAPENAGPCRRGRCCRRGTRPRRWPPGGGTPSPWTRMAACSPGAGAPTASWGTTPAGAAPPPPPPPPRADVTVTSHFLNRSGSTLAGAPRPPRTRPPFLLRCKRRAPRQMAASWQLQWMRCTQ